MKLTLKKVSPKTAYIIVEGLKTIGLITVAIWLLHQISGCDSTDPAINQEPRLSCQYPTLKPIWVPVSVVSENYNTTQYPNQTGLIRISMCTAHCECSTPSNFQE